MSRVQSVMISVGSSLEDNWLEGQEETEFVGKEDSVKRSPLPSI